MKLNLLTVSRLAEGRPLVPKSLGPVWRLNKSGELTAAMALGEVTYLTDAEALAADEANTGQISRAWDFWSSQAQA